MSTNSISKMDETSQSIINNDSSLNKDQTVLISQQKIQKYVDERRELYDILQAYLENTKFKGIYLDKLIKIINQPKYEENKEEFEHFLHLLVYIFDNHHRNESFNEKIFSIIKYYADKIKKNFSNFEIFEIFKNNKILLLFLFENSIICSDSIINLIINKIEKNGNRYCHFFYPEIKKFVDEEQIKKIEKEMIAKEPNIFDNFDQNRHKGENESYICHLIRQDSVEEFISHVNRSNIQLSSTIEPSIFETNSFLIKNNDISLIEYAAFFGSIQIFQYLKMNQVELKPSLWLYAIHSKNVELIHLLESYEVKPPNNDYEKCYIESIKCHHNDIADYIEMNLLPQNKKSEDVISSIFHYHNYSYFPSDFDNDDEFFYSYYYKFYTLADLLIKTKENEMEQLVNKEKYELGSIDCRDDNFVLYYYLLTKEKEIKKNYFCGNFLLTKIAIPSSITSINSYAFCQCRSLTHVAISASSIAEIENSLFIGCKSLKKIKIPSSVKKIYESPFYECTSLASIPIPFSLAENDNFYFEKCSKLTNVQIPSVITKIVESAFSECSSLNEVIISSSVTSIGNNAFSKCPSLVKIEIPSSVITIGNNAFSDCISLVEIQIPSSVITIGDNAFSNCQSLVKMQIPSSVTTIGKKAFSECVSLIKIKIPSSVTTIGETAFYMCSSLTQVELPSSLTSIATNLFCQCQKLVQISIPSSVTKIGVGAFGGCSSLAKVSIPSSVTEISMYAFARCSSLTQIKIPSSVTSINDSTFVKCTSLIFVSIPSSVTEICGEAFLGCLSLKQITIPPSVTKIDECAFSECYSLEEIIIPSSFTGYTNLDLPPNIRIIRK